ncbi:DeoR/GlpR family DNA-binding transcription regulator [Kushneria phosphatilytica]|uniref:DeoR/GlpR transcriptional regulator n=1 Tax=Kushneria phosphatilytica TaxID=657387 RepID=A0A1S1NMD0_9GAMM|nr:DeoR/GlpR family DNA-binding transcription regulator [Kushneria phosphatilytica]OHV08340.1 DeoR family transcriptional regulator [Kushneria phosphatilytica]QEL09755.1 DeoR/GlpR transcriptional regulator [Kushneria phosphatilytica]
MIPTQRRDYLLELLDQQTVLTINELTELLGVSHMTVRRDIAQLEQEGQVLSVSGGVRLAARFRHEPAWQEKASAHIGHKEAIAQRAAAMIHDGMSIYLDAGTTTFAMARLLTEHNDLSVVTNNFHISALLAQYPHIDLFHTGGRVNHENYSAVGPSVVEFLRQVNVDIAFLSSSSWHLERGVTTPDESKILIKQQLLQIASKSVLVADSTKYGRFGMFRACALEDVDLIITDDGLAAFDREAIVERDIALETVPITAPQMTDEPKEVPWP